MTNNAKSFIACEKARKIYQMGGRPSMVETQIILTKHGNYVYRHFLSGNSPQPSRIYAPGIQKDLPTTSAGSFKALAKYTDAKVVVIEWCLTGAQVERHYNDKRDKLPTVGSVQL